MIKLSPFAPTPYCSPAMEVDGLYFVKAPGDKFLSIYARYKNSTCWVPMHIGIPALQTLQQVRDVDRNISINSGSYENAHFYLRSADGDNMTAAYFTNGDGGAIQVGNTVGYQPLDLQPQGGLLMYRGLEVATKSWVQGAGIFAPISHVGAGGNAHAPATTASAGFMSSADKTKLDNLTQGITEETDPTVPAHVKAITTANISSWNAKENAANKSTTTTLGTSNTLYPTQNAVKVYVDTAITNNNGNYIPATQKGAVNGVATLGGDGKIPNTQLPALTITETFVVNSQAAMLALSGAGMGDIAVRTDINKSFILTNNAPGTLSSWQELLSPTITSTDQVPEGSNNLYYTIQRARQSISAGNGISYNSATGIITNTAPDQPSDLAIGTRTDTAIPVTNSNGTGITIPVATTTQAGLISGTDKTKLNGLSNYTLPTASASVLGGVKVGSGLSINATTGVLTATNTANGTVTNVTGTAPVNVTNGTTAPVISMTQAGAAANGWLSSADWNTFKNKLDNPGGNAGQFIDGTGTARDLVYKTPGTGTTYSGQYSKIARVEISTQYQDINARIELNLFNYSLASQLRSEIWLRVKQQAAFGSDPVIEAIHENPMATAQYELYYVIVQNTPSTILDVYVRPMGSNYAISFAPVVWPRTGVGSSVTFTPDSAYVASVAGAIGFTTRVPATRDWVAAQGYRTDIPDLQQVAAVGNIAGTDLYIGAGTNAVRVGAGTGVENTILGKDALTAATSTASWNVAIGTHALKSHTAGRNNTAIGESSMANYVSNPDNIFNNNTAVGNSSMLGNISGKSNTAIGTNAGMTDALRDRGDYNVFLGSNAGYNTSTATTPLGDYNIFIGPYAGVNESGSYKFVVGYNTVNEPSEPFLYGDMSAGTLDINADTTFSDTIKAPATPVYTTGGYTILALNTTTGIIEKVASLPFALQSVVINAGNGLTGGGNLGADRTITMGTPSAITLSSANSASGTTHSHAFTPGGTTAQYITGAGTLATFPAIPGTPNLQQVTDAGGATTNNVMMAGQVTIGAASAPRTFAADAAFLPGFTPNTEIITGNSSGVAYSEAVVIRHNGSGGTGSLQRELGLIFKMNADTNAAESQKMGAIMMRSLNGFSNNPDMLFFTRNAERMRLMDNGNIGIGTTSTLAKMEVARGTVSSADPIIAASQNGGSIIFRNGTASSSQFAPVIQGIQVTNNAWGLALVGTGADTYTQGAIVLRGTNAAGDAVPTGKLVSVQAYTSEVISMWANGNLKLAGGNVVLRDSNVKVVKNAASFRASTTSTGAIVFKHAPGAPGAMMTMKLKGYQYNSGRTFEITLSFYFNGATTIAATGKSAYIIASSALPGLADVYAGFDADGNLSVIIGEITTAWSSYLHLWIDEVTTAHTSYDNATWESGWSAALVSDLTGYTAITPLGLSWIADQPWVRANTLSNNSAAVGSTTNITNALDVNTVLLSGMQYAGTSSTNLPGTLTTGFVISNIAGSSGAQWMLSQQAEDAFWYRRRSSGTFGSWFQAASRDWVNTVLPTVNNGTLTLATSGIATGSASFTANQATGSTFTVNVPGTNITDSSNAGEVLSSTGTSGTLKSLARINMTDANAPLNLGAWHFLNTTGSTGYPSPTGSGVEVRRSSTDFSGAWGLFASNTGTANNQLYMRTNSSATAMNAWTLVADRDYVDTSIAAKYSNSYVRALDRGSSTTDLNTFFGNTGGFVSSYSTGGWDTNGAPGFSYGGAIMFVQGGTGNNANSGLQLQYDIGHGSAGTDTVGGRLAFRTIAAGGTRFNKWYEIATKEDIAAQTLQAVTDAGNNTTNEVQFSNTVFFPGTGAQFFANGTGDGASYTTYNMIVHGHWGWAFEDNTNTIRGVLDFRSGTLDMQGGFVTAGTIKAGSLSGTGTRMVTAAADGTLGTAPVPAYTGSTSVTLSGSSFQRAALTGDVTAAANSNATTIAANAVTYAKMQDVTGLSVIGRSANTTGDPGEITAAADGQVLRRSGTTIGFGTVATAGIADDAVTYAKMQDIASGSLLGRATTGTGDVEALTVGAGLSLSGGVLHADVMVIATSVSHAFGLLTSFVPVISADFPVAGAEVGDVVMLGLDPAAGSNGVQFKAFVSATGIVKIMAVNCANSSVTLASLPYKIKILK